MISAHQIQSISFINENLIMVVDGNEIKIPLDKASKKLKAASDMQRQFFKISPSGYGIQWPLIDEDLAVNALIRLAGR